MSGRFITLSLVVYILLFAGLVTLNGILIAFTLPFIIFLAAAYQYAPGELKMTFQRSFDQSYVFPGTPVVVTLTLSNPEAEAHEVYIEDHLPPEMELTDGETSLLTVVPARGQVELVYTVRGQRGGYAFRNASLTVYDRLGLFTRTAVLVAVGQILVKPDVKRLRSLAVRPLRTHGFNGAIPGRQGGSGMNFFGVREYQLGDQLRRINWRIAARHQQNLFTNEFERERVSDVGLILDARMRTDVEAVKGSLFEYGVSAAAALADMFLQTGNRVGLLIYGRGQETTFPGYGKVQREKILRALAQAATGDNMALESFSYLPTRLFPPRSQIVLISPLCQEDVAVLSRLRAYGYQIMVVSPDPVDYEARRFAFDQTQELAVRIARVERTLLLRQLQRVGIIVVDWSVEQPLGQVLQTSLGRSVGAGFSGKLMVL